jgi:chromate transporter
MIIWELFWRFFVISLLAFGGGAGITLIERTAVGEAGWVAPGEFTKAIALAQLTPGPVMIVATFIGYRAGGLAGATAATLGAFSMPMVLSAAIARRLERVRLLRSLRGFHRGAASAAVGLLGVTALSLGRLAVRGWADGLIVIIAVIVALGSKVPPLWVLIGGGLLGIVVDGCLKVSQAA